MKKWTAFFLALLICLLPVSAVAASPCDNGHTAGSTLHAPTYADCTGGFKSAWYECSVCGCAVDADGNDVPWYPAASQHDLVKIPYTPPTYTSDGYQTYWQCSICGQCFFDEDGTHLIADERDMASLIVPRLTDPDNSSLQTSISTGLTSVPETVAQQYPTVDAIYQALVQAAQGSNASLKQNDGSVLLDVTLQVRGDDGTLTTVVPENFPAEGVEVLLPYPQGTDRSCTFVITHMITSGERAGQIETLKGIKTKDGILVRFTSMSPVCITYRAHTSTGADRTAADTAVGVSSPKTADSSHVALWSAACVCSAALLLSMTVKKKKHA